MSHSPCKVGLLHNAEIVLLCRPWFVGDCNFANSFCRAQQEAVTRKLRMEAKQTKEQQQSQLHNNHQNKKMSTKCAAEMEPANYTVQCSKLQHEIAVLKEQNKILEGKIQVGRRGWCIYVERATNVNMANCPLLAEFCGRGQEEGVRHSGLEGGV